VIDSRPTSWLPATVGARAHSAAALIARRLADRSLVSEAVARCEATARYPYGWGGASLYCGEAGNALLFSQAAQCLPHERELWIERTRDALTRAAASTRTDALRSASVSSGTAGMALAVARAARVEPRYGPAAAQLMARLAAQVLSQPPAPISPGTSADDHDVVLGAAGVLAVLTGAHQPTGAVADAVRVLVDQLVTLCRPDRDGRRPWHLAPGFYPVQEYHRLYPHGFVNLGFAHGVPGILAALALSCASCHRRPETVDVVTDVAEHLDDARLDDAHGPDWPAGHPLDAAGHIDRTALTAARSAWCYGAPGVASALLTAAEAVEHPSLTARAVQAWRGALRRWRAVGGVDSPTFCHGLAGLLTIAVRFARCTGEEVERAGVRDLTQALLDHCRPDLPLGVRDVEVPGSLLDSPALLTGSAGVALALWTASGHIDGTWSRAMLVA
jgi:lantibiotic biosynthesis protein